MLNQEITSDITHLITGGTLNWSPSANLTNKFTVGYDLAQIENRNLRPFGFISAPGGIISSRRNSYENLTSTTSAATSSRTSPGCAPRCRGAARASRPRHGRPRPTARTSPGPGKPTVSSAGTTLGFEERQRVVNGGFFGQALFDKDNRYFLTLGFRVDGNSAFGKDFGLQYYPKASVSWVASEERFWPQWNPGDEVPHRVGPFGTRAWRLRRGSHVGAGRLGRHSPPSSRATSATPTSVPSARPRWSSALTAPSSATS